MVLCEEMPARIPLLALQTLRRSKSTFRGSRSAASVSSFTFETLTLVLVATGFLSVPDVIGSALSRFQRGFLEGFTIDVTVGSGPYVLSFVLLAARVIRAVRGWVAEVLTRDDERVAGVVVLGFLDAIRECRNTSKRVCSNRHVTHGAPYSAYIQVQIQDHHLLIISEN